MNNVVIKKSKIGQFDKGVFAAKDFKKGEIVVRYHLKPLTLKDFQNLSPDEKKFVHMNKSHLYLYSLPERYVNHSSTPNTSQDLTKKCDIATRGIKKGEEITTDSTKDDSRSVERNL